MGKALVFIAVMGQHGANLWRLKYLTKQCCQADQAPAVEPGLELCQS